MALTIPAVEGAHDIPYAIPNVLVDWHQAPGGVPTLWFALGRAHPHRLCRRNVSRRTGPRCRQDAFEFRRALLDKHPRHKRVLELVAEKAIGGSRCRGTRTRSRGA